jgi:ArsR family transcriptional regulator, arsenate/arsenite/antimonite-responsive transcriptional repressor
MKSEDVVLALGALAQESRLAIFRLLVKRGPDGYSPSDLVEKLEIPAPTLSFHLRELQRAGLIAARREGRFLYYSANFERMRGLISFLTEKCCSLSDTECDSACVPIPATQKRRGAA